MIAIILVLQMKTRFRDVEMTYPSYNTDTTNVTVDLKTQYSMLVRVIQTLLGAKAYMKAAGNI